MNDGPQARCIQTLIPQRNIDIVQEGNHTPSAKPNLYKRVTFRSGNEISIVQDDQVPVAQWILFMVHTSQWACQGQP